MFLLFLSFLAGVISTLTPCVLPVLPIIIGGTMMEIDTRKAGIIAISLSISIILFTLILKTSTLFISVPAYFWTLLSGTVLLGLGIITIFPQIWDRILLYTRLSVF